MRPGRLLTAISLVLILLGTASAQQKTGFVTKTYKNADGHDSPYVVFVPHDYDGATAVPGHPLPARLRRDEGRQEASRSTSASAPAIKKREKTFPFLAVIPQAEKRTGRPTRPTASAPWRSSTRW